MELTRYAWTWGLCVYVLIIPWRSRYSSFYDVDLGCWLDYVLNGCWLKTGETVWVSESFFTIFYHFIGVHLSGMFLLRNALCECLEFLFVSRVGYGTCLSFDISISLNCCGGTHCVSVRVSFFLYVSGWLVLWAVWANIFSVVSFHLNICLSFCCFNDELINKPSTRMV